MAERIVKVATGGLSAAILRDVEKALRRAAVRLKNRAVEIMREETPSRDGGLRSGVDGSVSRQNPPVVSIIASAIARRQAGNAIYVSASGKQRPVRLRGQRPFDYARAVAEGTGIFGPKGQRITPKRARVLTVPVDSPPTGEGYLIAGGKYFVFRRSVAGMAPNDYPGRTLARLDPEIDSILAEELAGL